MVKECDQPRNMDKVACKNYEKTAHMSRDCPEPNNCKFSIPQRDAGRLVTDLSLGSKVQCSNCQQYGHTKV